ncbi:uncharacterized protein [Rutidosis leptorrhynchoides]|uniref:uncharacterized protein n=1 Tax=Rutidosis leptorrhynchoides TaxID=125765 RepID=UPI003A995AC3
MEDEGVYDMFEGDHVLLEKGKDGRNKVALLRKFRTVLEIKQSIVDELNEEIDDVLDNALQQFPGDAYFKHLKIGRAKKTIDAQENKKEDSLENGKNEMNYWDGLSDTQFYQSPSVMFQIECLEKEAVASSKHKNRVFDLNVTASPMKVVNTITKESIKKGINLNVTASPMKVVNMITKESFRKGINLNVTASPMEVVSMITKGSFRKGINLNATSSPMEVVNTITKSQNGSRDSMTMKKTDLLAPVISPSDELPPSDS